MNRILILSLAALLVCFSHPIMAGESKEVRQQRKVDQEERLAQKKERTNEVREMTTDFRDFTKEIKGEYKDLLNDLNTEFQLKEIELEADHEARVTEAEAEYQKKLSELFLTPGLTFDQATVEKLQSEGKVYADELFRLKKQSAEVLHQERLAHEKRKNELHSEVDRKTLDAAVSLGLTREYSPILAMGVGGVLATQEERWTVRANKGRSVRSG